jgi:PmbA protein
MMIERIMNRAMKLSPGGWKIREEESEASELYLVGNEIEQTRAKELVDYRVTLYADFAEGGTRFLGDAEIRIHPGMSDSEIDERIARGVRMAGYVRNAWYPLAAAGAVNSGGAAAVSDFSRFESPFSSGSLIGWAETIAAEALGVPRERGERFSSTEVLMKRFRRRLVTSGGIDLACHGGNGYLEAIEAAPSACAGFATEVELFRTFEFSRLRPDQTARLMAGLLSCARERAKAEPLPKGLSLPVLFPAEHCASLFGYYLSMTDVKAVFEKVSPWTIGTEVGDGASYGALGIVVTPWLEGSPRNAPFDDDGLILSPTQVMKEGRVVSFHGSNQYASYLGVPATGVMGNVMVSGGSKSEAELRADPYLEALVFSDFNVDVQTGDFGGEIRLAMYHDGKRTVPVTGGSITGNLMELRESLVLSRETESVEWYRGPKLVRVSGASIAG